MRQELMLDGKRVQAEAQWIAGQLWIHLNGKTFVYESEAEKKREKKKHSAGHAGDLLAPMPGKVTKVLGQVGEQVQKGEPILVMEAMKMEYTLKAEGPGFIEAVHCKVGDQVTLGKVLVKIKAIS